MYLSNIFSSFSPSEATNNQAEIAPSAPFDQTIQSRLLSPRITYADQGSMIEPGATARINLVSSKDFESKLALLLAAVSRYPDVSSFFSLIDQDHFKSRVSSFLQALSDETDVSFMIKKETLGLNLILFLQGDHHSLEYVSGIYSSGVRDYIPSLKGKKIIDGTVRTAGDAIVEKGLRAYIPQLRAVNLVQGIREHKAVNHQSKTYSHKLSGDWHYQPEYQMTQLCDGTVELPEEYAYDLVYFSDYDFSRNGEYCYPLKGMSVVKIDSGEHRRDMLVHNHALTAQGRWENIDTGSLFTKSIMRLMDGQIDFAGRTYTGQWHYPHKDNKAFYFEGEQKYPNGLFEKGVFKVPLVMPDQLGKITAIIKPNSRDERTIGEQYPLCEGLRVTDDRTEAGEFRCLDKNNYAFQPTPTHLFKGTVTYQDGTVLEGEFAYIGDEINDIRLLIGEKRHANGLIESGNWQYFPEFNDTKLVLGKKITSEGKIFEGSWHLDQHNKKMLFIQATSTPELD